MNGKQVMISFFAGAVLFVSLFMAPHRYTMLDSTMDRTVTGVYRAPIWGQSPSAWVVGRKHSGSESGPDRWSLISYELTGSQLAVEWVVVLLASFGLARLLRDDDDAGVTNPQPGEATT